MLRHPSEGTLRRLLDEPVAVPLADERHAEGCSRCLARTASMSEDEAAVTVAFGDEPSITPATVALQRFHASVGRPLSVAPASARTPGARRRRLARPATVITAALVLTGGATAAAATHLVPIFQPETVTPITVRAADLSHLADLSRFGTFSGQSDVKLTPESSAAALSDAAGFAAPSVNPPTGVASGGASYWLVGPQYAQVRISVAKIDKAATKSGARAPSAPAGMDGSVLRVSTGNGVFEVWGALSLPGLLGNASSGAGSPAGQTSLLGHSSSRAASDAQPGVTGPGVTGPKGARPSHGLGSLAGEVPELAVAEIDGPTVSSSGANLTSLENYLLAQPEIPPSLAAEIRAIGDPSSTLPLPVPAGASSTTTNLNGHQAVVYNLGRIAHLVVWAASGHLFAVLGKGTTSDIIQVAGQVA